MLHKVTNQTRGSILLGPWDRSYVFKGTFHCETPSFKKSTFITSVSSSTFLQAFNAIPGTTWVHEMTSMCSTSKPSYRMSLSRAKHIKETAFVQTQLKRATASKSTRNHKVMYTIWLHFTDLEVSTYIFVKPASSHLWCWGL